LGFNRENVLLFRMNARQAGHQAPEISTFYSSLQKRFSAIPGVRGATTPSAFSSSKFPRAASKRREPVSDFT